MITDEDTFNDFGLNIWRHTGDMIQKLEMNVKYLIIDKE
jgi:hypothetical protein